MDFRNCPQCGKLFRYVNRYLCAACIEAEEKEFEIVRAYVRDNEGKSIPEVSEATGIAVEKIIRFLRNGKLIVKGLELDGALTCGSCGAPIDSGRLCEKCRSNLAAKLEQKVGERKPQIDNLSLSSTRKERMHTAGPRKR